MHNSTADKLEEKPRSWGWILRPLHPGMCSMSTARSWRRRARHDHAQGPCATVRRHATRPARARSRHTLALGQPIAHRLRSRGDHRQSSHAAVHLRQRLTSDRTDAVYLARGGRLDPGLLTVRWCIRSETCQVSPPYSAAAGLRPTRANLVNHARGMVKVFGARLPMCSTDAFAKKAQEQLPEALRAALGPVVEIISALDRPDPGLERKIEPSPGRAIRRPRSSRKCRGWAR